MSRQLTSHATSTPTDLTNKYRSFSSQQQCHVIQCNAMWVSLQYQYNSEHTVKSGSCTSTSSSSSSWWRDVILLSLYHSNTLQSQYTSSSYTLHSYIHKIHLNVVVISHKTRKLSYRKDDRVMCPTYGRPENFQESLTMHTATFHEFLTDFCSNWAHKCARKIWNP